NRFADRSANWQTYTSAADAAALLNVSERSVARARKVQENAPVDLLPHLSPRRILVAGKG
ncbi:MAG: hypothetical protein RQ806_10395, partial [Erythrobacter sp.]|nr:hypothetical protein [Erythrobacter sp.]